MSNRAPDTQQPADYRISKSVPYRLLESSQYGISILVAIYDVAVRQVVVGDMRAVRHAVRRPAVRRMLAMRGASSAAFGAPAVKRFA